MSDVNPVSAGAKILLVDDSLDNIDLLRKALEPKGYTISSATSGEAALALAADFLPDLVLLDVMMPGIDGFETCRRLKKDAILCDVPVIFISARIETKDVIEGFRLGGADYITKPFNRAVVVARVEMHLERDFLVRQREDLSAELEEASRKLEMLETAVLPGDLPHPGKIIQNIEFEMVRFQRSRNPFSLIRLGVDPIDAADDADGETSEAIWTQVDRLLKAMARKQDVVARWGKTMFLLFLPETDRQGAATFTDKFCDKLAGQTFAVAEADDRRITVSVGTCVFEENMGLKTCLKTAEERFSQARQAGGNRVVNG